jgi:hypothetical protein
LTLRRDRERRAIRVNRFNRNRLDFNHFCHFRETLQNQIKQFQSRDDHENRLKCNDKNFLKNEINAKNA